jgi:hypothetical protein
MSSTLKLNGGLVVGKLASAPANPQEGLIYFNTSSGTFQQYENGAFRTTSAEAIEAHLTNDANLKHDADEIDYQRGDGSRKNIQADATSGNVEAALTDLDDAIGALAATPTNYTPTDAGIVADHLAGIDSALATAGSDEKADNVFRITDDGDATKKIAFQASGITTETTRTVSMPDTDVDLGEIAANTAKVSADGSVTTHNDVTDAGSGAIITSAERTKLGGIEALADVTDALNVEAAGAVMESDSTTASMSFVIDEDDMVSDLATKVPTQQSVKAYVDTEIASAVSSGVTYKGSYDASANSPDLDTSPSGVLIGDMYTVTVAGTFFTTAVEVGDVLIAEIDDAAVEADWTIVNKNLDAASIKTAYESNADTNAFTDTEKTNLSNQSGTNTGDEAAASTIVSGIVELATTAETDAGTDTDRAVTPASLTNVLSDIAGKLDNIVEDTTPELGGDLDVGGFAIEDPDADLVIAGQNSVRRAKQASKSSFIEEEYIHSISLSSSQTNTAIAALTFAHATYEGLEITFKIKEATSGDVEIGTIRVVTNGTNIASNTISVESSSTGITFDAVINGANIEVTYSSGSNAATMRADVKKFLA